MSTTTTTTVQQDPLENKPAQAKAIKAAVGLFAQSVALSYHVGTWGGRLWTERSNQLLSPMFIASEHPLPGEAISVQAIQNSEKIRTALSLIDDFSLSGFSWSGENQLRISAHTADAAKALLSNLEPTFGLPKIAPNDELGLMMVWKKPNSSVLLVVDQWKVHLVRQAATPNAQYTENIPFDGQNAPHEVVEALK